MLSTLYVGNVEIVTDGSVTTLKRNIGGFLLQTIVGGVPTNQYLFHDQLGSVIRVTDALGNRISSMDFVPSGERRNFDDPSQYNGTAAALTPRGFTGHEHVDGQNVIHMNGRIYDPQLGRFLQADPLIQSPGNVQSWNAYTYVFNNPLAYTDPTGMISQSVRMYGAMAIALVAAVWTGGASIGWFSALSTTQAFAIVVTAAFASGAIATQSLKGGLQAAFGAALTFGIAGSDLGFWGQVGAQAVTGGIMESLQGGNFGNGFLAAGLTAAVMPTVMRDNRMTNTVVGAIVGGTISEVTGGKFANGAVSGAIQGAMSGQPEMPETDQRVSIEYRDQEYVGKFAKTPSERTAFARAMVRRGKLGDPSKVSYVDANPGRYMTAFPSGEIEVYSLAFETFDYYSFGSSLYHEYNHLARYAAYQRVGFGFEPKTQPHYMMDAEAYKMMLTNHNPFYGGTSKSFQYLMRLNDSIDGYGALTPSNQQRVRNNQFNCATGGGC